MSEALPSPLERALVEASEVFDVEVSVRVRGFSAGGARRQLIKALMDIPIVEAVTVERPEHE